MRPGHGIKLTANQVYLLSVKSNGETSFGGSACLMRR